MSSVRAGKADPSNALSPPTVVTFQSNAFNSTVVRPYFLNPLCFGDDLAQHLVCELEKKRYSTDTPAQEDFGWYFKFSVSGKAHLFLVGRRPVEQDWLGSIERVPFLLFRRGVDPEAVEAIDSVLGNTALFENVKWHNAEEFDAAEKLRSNP